MKFFFKSISTFSFWRHALLSGDAAWKFLAVLGAEYLLMEILDFLNIYTKDEYSRYAVVPMAILALLVVLTTRRPITRFAYKIPGRDFTVAVRIGDLFDGDNDVIVSANTTFDTDMASGLIDTDSVQGQVATRYFNANTAEIDRQLALDLAAARGKRRSGAPGKTTEYPIGTVARVRSHNRTFYFVAMSRLNDQGNAAATPREIEDALDATWAFVRSQGNLRNLAIPLMGTGRGRTGVPRKKMVERIAQSFVDGSTDGPFAKQLAIVIRAEDAENYAVNLYQIRDYVVQGVHG